MNTSPLMIIVGVSGTGKSTILNWVFEKEPSLNIINFGDQMLQVTSQGDEKRDQLRQLSWNNQMEIGMKAAQNIMKKHLSGTGTTIVDTHALIQSEEGYTPGLPKSVLTILRPSVIFNLEASAQHVLERRRKDKDRQRDLVDIHEVETIIQLTRQFTLSAVMFTGSLYTLVKNDEATPDKAGQRIVNVIQKLADLKVDD